MREQFFALLTRIVTRRPGRVLLVCALITVAMFCAMFRISMKTQISDMMPRDIPMVEEFKDIIDDYESASSIMIVVESKESDLKLMKRCAEDIAERLKSVKRLKPRDGRHLSIMQKLGILSGKFPVRGVLYDTLELVKRVDYRADNGFIAEHGLMMQKTNDLDNFTAMFESLSLPDIIENINDNFEKEFIDDAETMTTIDGEAQAVQGLKNMYRFVGSIGDYLTTKDTAAVAEAVDAFITGPRYFISPDNTLLMLMLQPTVDMDEFEDAMYLGYRITDTLTTIRNRYPELDIGGTGWMLLQIDEMEASKKDFGWPSLFALLLILLLLIGSYRTWKAPLFSVVTLAVALIWTAGLLGLVFHYLNMMSAAFGLILIGLGIDFGIHFISGFKDGKEQGLSVAGSVAYMYTRVGSGVMTGALTTAIVFFSLTVIRFKAFSEMGIAIGSGIVIAMLAAMILLPALMVWNDKGYSLTGTMLRRMHLGFAVRIGRHFGGFVAVFFSLKPFRSLAELLQFHFLDTSGRLLSRLPVAVAVLLVACALTILSLQAARNIEFEYNMMELEPVGIPSVIVQDKILDKYEIAPDYAMFRVSTIEECRDKVDHLKRVGNKTGSIGGIDALSEFIPSEEVQHRNIPRIENFRSRISAMPIKNGFTAGDGEKCARELVRLHQNIAEIGELSVMNSGESNKIVRTCDRIVGKTDAESRILALSARINDLKPDPSVLAPYQCIAGSIIKERLLRMSSTDRISLHTLPEEIRSRYVSPSGGSMIVTVFPKSNIWEERILRKFTEETSNVSEKITGMPPMTLLFLDLMKEKGRIAVIVGALAIFLFLLVDFRSIRKTVFAMIPLAMGSIWMVGLMALTGMKLNFVNFMCLPLILGIGIDDGVHILHRYEREGRGAVPAVLRFTGRSILLTSLTTMIGFGSMGLASHRGTASMGQLLFLGVGACFISSAYVLPAIITIWEKMARSDTQSGPEAGKPA
ncbi:MAG: MMPL family transporter [Chitinispirillaceae bacterium]|nr:MMPL family transporter [Chitinispirillaceae bacterium]